MPESEYKKSEVDFAGLNLPSKYKFRRTEWAKEPEPVATKTLDGESPPQSLYYPIVKNN